MPAETILSLDTRILDLPATGVTRIGSITARNLALGLAEVSSAKDINTATVEDLLLYLPMRYEDRSHLMLIRDLQDGVEASLELFVKLSGGHPIRRRRRSYRQRLYVFKISATDRQRTGKDVVIWTFLSGPHAPTIIENYTKKFSRGVRFIAFGKWKWDAPDQTYTLQLHKPDEIEILPPVSELPVVVRGQESEPEMVARRSSVEPAEESSLAAIHVGRCVPVYRKVKDIRSKQLRETIHRLLESVSDEAIVETLPPDLRQRQKLIERAAALRQIHFPPEDAALADYDAARSPAHRRLIFEELFWLALALLVKRGQRIKDRKDATIKIDDSIKRRIASVLPFKLTEPQRKVVKEIFRDMQSDAP